MAQAQIQEFFATYDIIDHLPNQSSGFSATLLKNRKTDEYTLAFRSTEFRDIDKGGDAERDSIRGAAGDIAFNGMALAQVSSMEKYWNSLLDGSRAGGATPDKPGETDTRFIRAAELKSFRDAMAVSTNKINVSGYSLGGHLATMFSVFHGKQVSSLYLFNSSGVGRIREGFSSTAYRDALASYDKFMQPGMEEEAIAGVLDWASRATLGSAIGAGARARINLLLPSGRMFLPKELGAYFHDGSLPMQEILTSVILKAREQRAGRIPEGSDKIPIRTSSALHFLVSLFATEGLEGTYGQTLGRAAGRTYPSLREGGLIDPSVSIFQISGLAAEGAPSVSTFSDMRKATDWNIVADSGIRAAPDAQLLSVYIENQPTASGWPFDDRGWGDFGNTHSVTLIVDSLAVTRMLQKADSALTQREAEQIMQAASSLRKEGYSFMPGDALAEHDTLERVVDAFGRVLFGRRTVNGIDWSQNLPSANGVSSFGLLEFRDPFYARIAAIEKALEERGLGGTLRISSLAASTSAALYAGASTPTEQGKALRYALRELNGFLVLGPGLYDDIATSASLALYDAASGTGALTPEWLQDRADFLALKMRLDLADRTYEIGERALAYTSKDTGDAAFVLTAGGASAYPPPDDPESIRLRSHIAAGLETAAGFGTAGKIVFGRDGDPAANPSMVSGGADTLRGGAGADHLYGEGGNDRLFAGGGADYVEGGRGDDLLFGNAGNDVLAGGRGYDEYVWASGDGFDRISDAREAEGMRGRIVLRDGSAMLVPRLFKRDPGAPVESYRSPDRSLLLSHNATWILSFPGGEIDLGPDFRDGDLGMKLESAPPAHSPTIIGGVSVDSDVIGPNAGSAFLFGGYGHDRLFSDAVIALDTFLQSANAAPMPGWGRWLSAGPGDDLALGTAASDIVLGGGGADNLAAGPGDDLVDGDADSLPVFNGSELDWDFGPNSAEAYDTEFLVPGLSTLSTDLDPVLYREQTVDGDDVLHGGGGNDRMYGHGGDDLLYGDPGNDVMVGGEGADVLFGGDGDDRITGENHGYAPRPFDIVGDRVISYPHYAAIYGDDVIDGGGGDDELAGEGGNDVLAGGAGDDSIYGDIGGLPGDLHGADLLDGGEGSDRLFGQGGDDVIFGGAGNDQLIGDSDTEARWHGADVLDGEDGNDLLVGAGGRDELLGGAGDDTLIGDALDVPSEWQAEDVLDGGDGDDLLYGLGGADELFGSNGDDRLYGDDPDSAGEGQADRLEGGAGDDELHGEGGADRLLGGAGADRLFGDAGNDTLSGGEGADALDGGSGDDRYEFVAGDGSDRLSDAAGLITLSFLDGVELSALRAARVLGTGAGIAPVQIAYSANDSITLEGLTDLSRLRIEMGGGEILGGAELELLSEATGPTLSGSAASEIVAADGAASNLFAFNGDDLLLGSDAADRLHGGAGDDELHGLGGDDILRGGEDADRLDGGPGTDTLEGGAGDDVYVFARGAGIDSAIEAPAEGLDTVELAEGMAADEVRLRRSGNDLVIVERAGDSRIYARDWFKPGREVDRGIDAIDYDGGSLDAAAIESRIAADRILPGTPDADVITGDEFDDIVIGGAGDDVLAGLSGNDHYIYARGDGDDRIVDTGGYDVIEFGEGIEPGEITLVGSPDSTGALAIDLYLAGNSAHVRFGEAHERRIDEFRFAGGEVYDYAGLVGRQGGLRQDGSDNDDVLLGGFNTDSLYGFQGNDTLMADAGADLLVGAEGADFLAGGANDDTYVFNAGDGRDSILEYNGRDEYLLFRGYYTESGRRAFDLDGVRFESREDFAETFDITLGSVAGGVDTLAFRENIAEADIHFGLDLSKPDLPYTWLVPAPGGGTVPGTVYAEQVAVVLEIGDAGDGVELLVPNVERSEQATGLFVASAPIEHVVFGESEPVGLADLFSRSGGWSYMIGSQHADRLSSATLLQGAWIAGGAGDDVYLAPEQRELAVLELPGEGIDTIAFGDGVSPGGLGLVFDQSRLIIATAMGRVSLEGFAPAQAQDPLIERFEFADGSTLGYAGLLDAGIDVPGTLFDDTLSGTSADDRVLAGAGADHVEAGSGDDVIDGAEGDDSLAGNAGEDWIRGGIGEDRMLGGPGRDVYLFMRGDGEDVIEETGTAGEADTLAFGAGIEPGEVSAHRAGGDMVLDIAANGGQIKMLDWFTDEAMRVETVTFADGTRWNAETLATLTGSTLHAPEPHDDPPAVTPAPGGEEAAQPQPPLPPSAVAAPDPSAGQTAAFDTPAPVDTPAAPAPVAAEALQVGAPESAFAAAPSASAPTVEPAAEAGPPSAPVFVSTNAPAPIAGAVASPSGTMETLADAGFVSPGRAMVSPSESSAETIAPESVPADEAPPTDPSGASSAAVAAYWHWMHARLDLHLEQSEPDDIEAAPCFPRLALGIDFGHALQSLAPARAIGLREGSGFDARKFEGLNDGITRLG